MDSQQQKRFGQFPWCATCWRFAPVAISRTCAAAARTNPPSQAPSVASAARPCCPLFGLSAPKSGASTASASKPGVRGWMKPLRGCFGTTGLDTGVCQPDAVQRKLACQSTSASQGMSGYGIKIPWARSVCQRRTKRQQKSPLLA